MSGKVGGWSNKRGEKRTRAAGGVRRKGHALGPRVSCHSLTLVDHANVVQEYVWVQSIVSTLFLLVLLEYEKLLAPACWFIRGRRKATCTMDSAAYDGTLLWSVCTILVVYCRIV